ncbi:MAG: hypothetical protein KF884_02615 [Fimbriimonadaceae bacterium]|nr:hypothetical protein [Fimbriimonadaceae bacterium]QYK58988.1 MAG: hypothetical protein KF884_02615 [Fimbriimonadaceae bacterium]
MFFSHPRLTAYDFGPRHPLRPERLDRSLALLELAAPDIERVDPGLLTESDLLRVHSQEYIDFVKLASDGKQTDHNDLARYGLAAGDTPAYLGMYEASLAFGAASVRAAEAVRDGAAVAVTHGGGLHHAQRNRASGFCIVNDLAIAIMTLRERFERVAYVDIDLHHGDGVQALFYDDPSVLTLSVHQDGRTLYPGTGFVEESGAGGTAWNLPLPPGTTGDVWAESTIEALLVAFDWFRPEAVVLQTGADPHFLDPLGHLMVTAQEWLEPVTWVMERGLPTVAAGGGGYEITAVPRMWAAATLTLLGRKIPEIQWPILPDEWGLRSWWDDETPCPRGHGVLSARRSLSLLKERV